MVITTQRSVETLMPGVNAVSLFDVLSGVETYATERLQVAGFLLDVDDAGSQRCKGSGTQNRTNVHNS